MVGPTLYSVIMFIYIARSFILHLHETAHASFAFFSSTLNDVGTKVVFTIG